MRRTETFIEDVGYIGIPIMLQPLKRYMDVVIALIGLIIASPLIFLIYVAIKLQDAGPVFFKQERIGKNGIPFTMYKFRSMVRNAEAVLKDNPKLLAKFRENFKLDESDPRITPVGRVLRKTSLDELPQLFNVLKGEMSFVGPRPKEPGEIQRYYSGLEWKLLAVKPGITGYWQCYGRGKVTYPERTYFELHYIDNFSFLLDSKLF